MARNGKGFVFYQLNDDRWSIVCTARKCVLKLSFASFPVTMQYPHMLPEFSTSQAAVGFYVNYLRVFDK